MAGRPGNANCFQWYGCCDIFVVIALLGLWLPVPAEANIQKHEPVQNPHGNAAVCESCHVSDIQGRSDLRFDGNVSQLCLSCHDGQLAARQGHPSDVRPSAAMSLAMASDFPLFDGMVTCLSCHDAASQCASDAMTNAGNRNFLRNAQESLSPAFCFFCHIREDYVPYNAHDQIEAGEMKSDMCLWCHTGTPEVNSVAKEGVSYELHDKAYGVCENCHTMDKSHPTNVPHTGESLTAEMEAYMYALEIQHRMNMPFDKLLAYVRSAKRKPRLLPLDEKGCITCFSCHNPHEKGLFPNTNYRSVGADAKKAANNRLRVPEGGICRSCHYK